MYESSISVHSFLLLPSSLSVFCSVSAVSCLGFGPLCPSMFPHQTRTPADDPGRHPLSPPVEGGLKKRCISMRPQHHSSYVTLLLSLCWQVSMLGSRFAVLMLFTRVFKQWVLGVIGRSSFIPPSFFKWLNEAISTGIPIERTHRCLISGVHWLGATFWMVSQQTDIIRSTSRWRLFNLLLGAIHIFLFLNVKYGRSRYRMVGFYVVCARFGSGHSSESRKYATIWTGNSKPELFLFISGRYSINLCVDIRMAL